MKADEKKKHKKIQDMMDVITLNTEAELRMAWALFICTEWMLNLIIRGKVLQYKSLQLKGQSWILWLL